MQYPVPQFDDVEDKVIGPLSFRQFIYLAGGVGLSYALFRLLPAGINLLVIGPVAGLSLALAFYKINNQPFISIIESAFYYSLRNKLYLWSHRRPQQAQPTTTRAVVGSESLEVPSMSNSKIKELAWSLDINEQIERAHPDTTSRLATDARRIAEENILNSL